MSGILGVWNSQKPAPWQKMLDDLTVLGKDGKGDWHNTDISLSLGRTQLFNTPESCQENPVVQHDGCVLVWDGRVDARESLLSGRSHITDAQLIIESYRRWGVDCLKHLIGEFAFILWDASQRSFVCGLRSCRWQNYCLLLGWADSITIFASFNLTLTSSSKPGIRSALFSSCSYATCGRSHQELLLLPKLNV